MNTVPQQAHVCPICAAEQSRPIPFRDPDSGLRVLKTAGYHWRLCGTCGNAFPTQTVSLAELQQYWDRNRVIDDTPAAEAEAVWQGRWQASQVWAQRTYDFVAPFLRPDMQHFLDVACGLGATVALFRDKGWQAEGVDADPNTRQFHEKAGVSVTIGQVENLQPGAAFDVVSIAHAIYFVSRPRQFVQQVAAMLKPDGLFVVIVSDLLSSFSDSCPGYAHTWYPSADALVYLLEQEGFVVIARRRLKGSIMILAKPGQTVAPRAFPRRDYWLHMSQAWRFKLLGRPYRCLVNGLKKLLRK
ncbi:class I SAM-dependent methyltransferase [Methylomonas sp. HW2-6]|uniref:class I SAM-dependent methyltransferase n=1 Tax=Methylomonas TaxID=416 RepID=UPI00112EF62A|nr:class I SAM-dependent methyltransferase [Methylomonas koyamae]TPQ28506.1 hypothetical protein C2U68_04680 [Methylomonas koyamae]